MKKLTVLSIIFAGVLSAGGYAGKLAPEDFLEAYRSAGSAVGKRLAALTALAESSSPADILEWSSFSRDQITETCLTVLAAREHALTLRAFEILALVGVEAPSDQKKLMEIWRGETNADLRDFFGSRLHALWFGKTTSLEKRAAVLQRFSAEDRSALEVFIARQAVEPEKFFEEWNAIGERDSLKDSRRIAKDLKAKSPLLPARIARAWEFLIARELSARGPKTPVSR